MAFDQNLGPFIIPRPPRQFRPQLPTPPPPAPTEDPESIVPLEGLFRSQPILGPEFQGALGPSGTSILSSGSRPTIDAQALRSGSSPTFASGDRTSEELYRHAFAPAWSEDAPYAGLLQAPGARELAADQLKTRLGDEEYTRSQQRAITSARTGMDPTIQAQEEAKAKRATYPAQAQAQGLGRQALLNFMGRQATAQGTVEARRAARDASAIAAIERSISAMMDRPANQPLTADEAADLQRLREGLEQVKRGVYFLSDIGFTDQELDELADIGESLGIGEDQF